VTRRKTDEQFKQEVYDLVGNEYTFLDKYVNAVPYTEDTLPKIKKYLIKHGFKKIRRK